MINGLLTAQLLLSIMLPYLEPCSWQQTVSVW